MKQWLSVALIASCGCAHGKWETLGPVPTSPDPDAVALIELDEHVTTFHEVSGRAVADTRVHRIVAVLRADARLGDELVVAYHREFDQILSLHARVVFPDGSTREVNEAPSDVPYFSSMELYQDVRLKRLALPTVPPGARLETEYVVRALEPRLLPVSVSFGATWPVLRARMEVSVPADWALEWSAREMMAPIDWNPKVSPDGTQTRYLWTAQALPAFSGELGGPPLDEAGRRLSVRLGRWTEGGHAVTALRDARELSAWAYALAAPQTTASAAIRNMVDQVVREERADPEKVARRLYDFAADKVQYCAIELGMGGWRPHSAEEVFSLRYGDCKDKANLLRTMLELAHIPSELVLVFHHGGLPHPFGLPLPAMNFNHALLSVTLPTGALLVDPTSRTVPFGELPFGDAEAPILRVSAQGHELERGPALGAEANEDALLLALEMGDNGQAKGHFSFSSKGAPAEVLRGKLREAVASKRPTVGRQWMSLPRADLADMTFAPEGKGPVQMEGSVTSHAFGLAGKSLILRPTDALPPGAPSLPGGLRRGPYVMPYRRTQRVTLKLALPPGTPAVTLPKPVEISGDLARYRLSWSMDGAALKLDRELVWREHVVPAARYPELKTFCDAALAADAQPLVIHLP